jgi:hypothetical protein
MNPSGWKPVRKITAQRIMTAKDTGVLVNGDPLWLNARWFNGYLLETGIILQ